MLTRRKTETVSYVEAPSLAAAKMDEGELGIHVWVQYFRHSDPVRCGEIDHAVQATLRSGSAKVVHFLQEPGQELPPSISQCVAPGTTVHTMHVPGRLTFNVWLQKVREYTAIASPRARLLHVLLNADIEWTMEAAAGLRYLPWEGKTAACVLRWESDGTLFGTRWDSQDCWVVSSTAIPRELSVEIGMGLPGCDNRFIHELLAQGFNVYNPPGLIRTVHHHASDIRDPTRQRRAVPPHYAYVMPTLVSLDPTADWLMDCAVSRHVELKTRAHESVSIVQLPWTQLAPVFANEEQDHLAAGVPGYTSSAAGRTNHRIMQDYLRAASDASIVCLEREDHHPLLSLLFPRKCLLSAMSLLLGSWRASDDRILVVVPDRRLDALWTGVRTCMMQAHESEITPTTALVIFAGCGLFGAEAATSVARAHAGIVALSCESVRELLAVMRPDRAGV